MPDTKPTKVPKLTEMNFPVFEGWVLLAEAAEILKISRQHAYRMARDGEFESVRRLGTSTFFVVSSEEVDKHDRSPRAESRRAKRVASDLRKAAEKERMRAELIEELADK